MRLELEGFYPLVWIIFIFVLRSKTAPFVTKNQIIKFLILNPFFCTSIEENWTNLAGEFLEALAAPPSLRRTMFVQTLDGDEEECARV